MSTTKQAFFLLFQQRSSSQHVQGSCNVEFKSESSAFLLEEAWTSSICLTMEVYKENLARFSQLLKLFSLHHPPQWKESKMEIVMSNHVLVSLFFLPIFPKQRTMKWSPKHDSLLAISCTSHDVFWLWNKPGNYASQMMRISAQKQTPKNMHLLHLIRVDVLLCIFSIVILKVEWNGRRMNISQSTWISCQELFSHQTLMWKTLQGMSFSFCDLHFVLRESFICYICAVPEVKVVILHGTSVGDTILLILALCIHSVFEGIAIGVSGNSLFQFVIPGGTKLMWLFINLNPALGWNVMLEWTRDFLYHTFASTLLFDMIKWSRWEETHMVLDVGWVCRHCCRCMEGTLDHILAQDLCSNSNGHCTSPHATKPPFVYLYSICFFVFYLHTDWNSYWHHNWLHHWRFNCRLDLCHIHGDCNRSVCLCGCEPPYCKGLCAPPWCLG